MAKYEDYASGLEQEIDNAAKQSDQRARDVNTGRFIPERFKDKSVEDVIQSYEELEKLNSRQSQDLGAMRKTVDQLLEIQTQQVSSPAVEPSKPLSVDDLYEDADGNVRRVAKEEVSYEVAELRKELDELRVERAMSKLENEFNDWQKEVAKPEFSTWVNESPYRQRMYQRADGGDFDAAEEILGMYYDHSRIQESDQQHQHEQSRQRRDLQDAVLETSSPEAPTSDESYSRYDLMEARIAAKRGDSKAERWLAAHADAIARAYEEGRVID